MIYGFAWIINGPLLILNENHLIYFIEFHAQIIFSGIKTISLRPTDFFLRIV